MCKWIFKKPRLIKKSPKNTQPVDWMTPGFQHENFSFIFHLADKMIRTKNKIDIGDSKVGKAAHWGLAAK